MPVSVLSRRKKVEHMETVLPKKEKEAVKKVTIAEAERDSEEKVVMAAARDTAITAAAITMVVISDSIVAHPIAIGTMC